SPSPAASTPRTRSNTSATAASCLTCCGAWPRLRPKLGGLSRTRKPAAGDIDLRPPLPADHLEIAALVARLIPRYLGRGFSAEGIAILRENTKGGVIGAKLGGLNATTWSPAFVAIAGPRILGFGAVRNETHITQLHVDEAWHGRGIGHRLARAL